MAKTKNKFKFKSRSQRVFHALLELHKLNHCAMEGVKPSSAMRLYHGDGLPTVRVLESIAPFFGKDGRLLVKAWLEDKLDQMPRSGKGVMVFAD